MRGSTVGVTEVRATVYFPKEPLTKAAPESKLIQGEMESGALGRCSTSEMRGQGRSVSRLSCSYVTCLTRAQGPRMGPRPLVIAF